MTYRKLHLYVDISRINIRGTREIYNLLTTTVGIFNQFVNGLQDFDIRYINFNHYPGGNNTEIKLTIRYEFTSDIADMSAVAIAQDLEDKNMILRWDFDEATLETHIKTAHKLASFCVSVLISHSEFRVEFVQRTNQFIFYFLKLLLEKIGYQFPIIWDCIRDYVLDAGLSNQVDTWTDECLQYAPTNQGILNNLDFLERFIHLFLNCLSIQGQNLDNEKEIWRIITLSNSLDNIRRSY